MISCGWLLVISLLAPLDGFNPVTVLGEFETLAACQPERNRVGYEMAEAYPYDRDFVIECREA